MAAASLGLVAYGASRTAFVPTAQGSVSSDPGMALRGAVAGGAVAPGDSTTVSRGMVCVSGAMVVAALGHAGNHRSRGVARKAVDELVVKDAVDDAVKAEPEAPPPPPPFNPAGEVGVTAPLGFF